MDLPSGYNYISGVVTSIRGETVWIKDDSGKDVDVSLDDGLSEKVLVGHNVRILMWKNKKALRLNNISAGWFRRNSFTFLKEGVGLFGALILIFAASFFAALPFIGLLFILPVSIFFIQAIVKYGRGPSDVTKKLCVVILSVVGNVLGQLAINNFGLSAIFLAFFSVFAGLFLFYIIERKNENMLDELS